MRLVVSDEAQPLHLVTPLRVRLRREAARRRRSVVSGASESFSCPLTFFDSTVFCVVSGLTPFVTRPL